MTHGDEENEFKLCGFRFDPWMERWRLATTVMRIPCGVTFLQLNRFGREAPRSSPPTTLTSPDGESVLTDKAQIYHTLAKAAVVCEGWMTRLSDEDISNHIATVDELNDSISSLLSANTKVGFESGVGAVLRLLHDVEENDDLGRFVRCYKTAAEGTHFLDAFYAPLLLRIHIVNIFATSVWTKAQFDFAGQFQV